jgi:acyl-CoA synthetase (AMP-forming)/AMP-acid ligase II
VIGIPDPNGARLHAIVVPRNGAMTPGRAGGIATIALQMPRSAGIANRSLPVSAAGKIQKNVLRELLAQAEKRVN